MIVPLAKMEIVKIVLAITVLARPALAKITIEKYKPHKCIAYEVFY